MKILITLFFLLNLFILNSCSNLNADELQDIEKKEEIKIKKLSDFGSGSFLEKSGVLKSKQAIFLISNVYGTTPKINYNEGDKISEGEPILRLKDNIKNYYINVEKANNSIEKLELKYESTKLSYEKQENNLINNISSLKSNLENLIKNKGKNIEDIDINLDENNLDNKRSKSNLQLEKIKNLQKEAELNLENKIAVNKEELSGIKNILKGYYDAFYVGTYDIVQFGDEILGITELNKEKNDDFDMYLGGKSDSFKKEVIGELKNLIKIKEEVKKFNKDNLEEDNIKYYIKKLEEYYEEEKKFLNNFEKLLKEYSIICVDFSQTKIDNYVEEINSYQSNLQRANKDLVDFKNKTNKFLDSYKKQEEALEKKVDNLKKEKEILIKNLESNNKKGNISKDKINIEFDDKNKELKNKIKSLEKDLEILKKDKELSLKTIENSIKDAKISKKEALTQYKKLTIISPINGIIKKIFISKGQQITPQTKLFAIINNNIPQVKIFFSKDELQYLKENMDVFIINKNNEIKAKLISFSNIADDNLQYSGIVKIPKNINNFGEVLKIKININSKTKLVDLNLIRLSDKEGVGKIEVLDDFGNKKFEEVYLGKIFGNKIEILGCVNKEINCNNLKVILNK